MRPRELQPQPSRGRGIWRQLLSAGWIVSALLGLGGCRRETPRAPALGEAFAGPATLTLREAISLKSPPAATVKHGDKLEIVGTRRRFVKVRTAQGKEGWTHERSLLSGEEIENLRSLRGQTEGLQSHGEATSYGPLNVHTEPYRQAPSFLQIHDGDRVEMLRHQLVYRGEAPPRKKLLPDRPSATPKPVKRSKGREPDVPPPPHPKAPAPPEDWANVTKRGLPPDLAGAKTDSTPMGPPAPPPRDEWTLIRTRTGQCGWVLRNRLVLTLPDEILQHAEGRRITGYFRLAETRDRETGDVKPVWLWTTVDRRASDYDFDSARVFVWNQKRRRYETGFIDRNWKGQFPVVVGPVEARGAAGQAPGFTLRIEKGDGRIHRRTYGFIGERIRFLGEQLER